MAQSEPYYDFVVSMFNQGILQPAEIVNKNILLLGRCTVEGIPLRIEPTLKDGLLAAGAKTCVTYGLFAGPGADIVDDYENISQHIDGKFDVVIHLEGLEKSKNLAKAVAEIKNIMVPNGIAIIVTRTPKIVGTSMKVNYYEDYWRFDSESLRHIFADCKYLADVSTDADLFTALKVQKPVDFSLVDLSKVKVYSNKIKEYILPVENSYNQGYFKEYQELDFLGDVTRTDKCSYDHNYLDKYEFFLKKFKNEAINVLELGVFGGSSLRLWKNYFSQAVITGVDIEPSCVNYRQERIDIVIGDLANTDVLEDLKQVNPTIIIDDASHFWSHQIKALFTLFDSLPHGGVYILEDMETSVNPELYPEYADFPISAYEVCSRIARIVAGKNSCDDSPYKEQIEKIGMETELISIMKGSCVFIKR